MCVFVNFLCHIPRKFIEYILNKYGKGLLCSLGWTWTQNFPISALKKAEITGIQHKLEQLNIINVHINFIWEQSILVQKIFLFAQYKK